MLGGLRQVAGAPFFSEARVLAPCRPSNPLPFPRYRRFHYQCTSPIRMLHEKPFKTRAYALMRAAADAMVSIPEYG